MTNWETFIFSCPRAPSVLCVSDCHEYKTESLTAELFTFK